MSDSTPGSLADRAYELLRVEILECKLAPGSQVTERSIATTYDLGLSAVRAALVRLSSENLLTAVPRVGYQVSPITLRGIGAFFEAWEMVGPQVMRLAVTRMSEDQRTDIASLPLPAADADPGEFVKYAAASWDILVAATENAVLADFCRRLEGDMYRIFTLAWRSNPNNSMSTLNLNSVIASSPEMAEEFTLAYIRETRAVVTDLILASTSIANASVRFPI